MPSTNEWNRYFMKLAIETANLSKDPSTKVGAVIVTPDHKHISIGYNGFAKGLNESPERWNDRDIKLKLVIHSEENSIINCPFSTVGCKIYVTLQPCMRCMSRLVNAGIEEVYFLNYYERLTDKDYWLEHAKLFKECKQINI